MMNKERATQIAFFILRVVAGFMFMQAGASKVFGLFGGTIVPAMSQVWIGGVIELIGGAFIIVGFLTRPTAFVLSGQMAVAYWQFHFKPEAFWPVQNGGVPAVLYCFLFLFISAHGAGELSLDAKVWKRGSGGG